MNIANSHTEEYTAALQQELAECKQAKLEMEREALRHAILMAAYHDGIAIINQEHQVIEANGRFAEMLGYTPQEVLNLHTWDWEAILTESEIRANFADLTNADSVFETRHRRKDGTIFDVEVSVCGAKVGEEALVFTISRDITERKRAAEELRQHRSHLEDLVQERTAELTRTNQELQQEIAERMRVEGELRHAKEVAENAQLTAEEASLVKSEFLARMSHELRTPLHIIIGMSYAVLETGLSLKQRKSVEAIQSASDKLLRMINDILDFSKIETGQLTLEPVNFRVNDILERVSDQVTVKAKHKKLALRIEVGYDVPLALIGTPELLEHILIHLTDNAVKFTNSGEIVLRVELAQKSDLPGQPDLPPGRMALRFSVQDSGIGLSPEETAIIFETFTQADGSSTRKYGGTGLGLALCKRLTTMMGGQIWVESEAGQGSTFYFSGIFDCSSEGKNQGTTVLQAGCISKQLEQTAEKKPENLQFAHDELLLSSKVKPLLIELAALLGDGDLDAVNHLATLYEYVRGTAFDEQFQKLEAHINHYDFDKAQAMLSAILQRIQQQE